MFFRVCIIYIKCFGDQFEDSDFLLLNFSIFFFYIWYVGEFVVGVVFVIDLWDVFVILLMFYLFFNKRFICIYYFCLLKYINV